MKHTAAIMSMSPAVAQGILDRGCTLLLQNCATKMHQGADLVEGPIMLFSNFINNVSYAFSSSLNSQMKELICLKTSSLLYTNLLI